MLGKGTVVVCYERAFKNLKVGSKVVLVCPSGFAYGKTGIGMGGHIDRAIPPDATVVFEVDYLSCTPKKSDL